MTTITQQPDTQQPVNGHTQPPTTRGRSALRSFGSYVWRSWLLSLRDWSFLVFVIALPVTMYAFFSGIYGDETSGAGTGGVRVAAVMMVTMAAYGGLGAAMSAGAQIQAERSTGWFRQLMLTSLTPARFMAAKVIVAISIVIPAIGMVFLAGRLFRSVDLPIGTWLASGGLLLVSLLPMIVLGLVIGLWLKPQAAQAATTMTMLVLSMIGGLWFPLEMMPSWMQTVGRLLPSYWAGRLGIWPIVEGDFPLRGVVVIGVWAIILVAAGVFGYRHATRTSRR